MCLYLRASVSRCPDRAPESPNHASLAFGTSGSDPRPASTAGPVSAPVPHSAHIRMLVSLYDGADKHRFDSSVLISHRSHVAKSFRLDLPQLFYYEFLCRFFFHTIYRGSVRVTAFIIRRRQLGQRSGIESYL